MALILSIIVSYFGVFWEKLRFGLESNIKTPKNKSKMALTSKVTLKTTLEYSLEFRYCFFDEKLRKSAVLYTQMCHRIGQFSCQNPTLDTVLEVLRGNRRSLYNWTSFWDGFFPFSSKSGARGRGCGKLLLRKCLKSSVFSCFQDAALSVRSGGQE